MAEHDRRRERYLRQLEEELGHCRSRAEEYEERAESLAQQRRRLAGVEEPVDQQDPPGRTGSLGGPPAGPGTGGLAEIMNSFTPQQMQQIGQALQGVDLGAIMGALGGGRPGPVPGLLGGSPAGLPAGLPGGLPLGLPRMDIMGALNGLSEVTGFFSQNPLRGHKWTLKDVSNGFRLLRSPNVQALVGTAGAAVNLVRAGSKLKPLLAGLRSGRKAARPAPTGRPRGTPGKAGAPAAPPAAPPTPPPIRFRRPEGPPPVLEPWPGKG